MKKNSPIGKYITLVFIVLLVIAIVKHYHIDDFAVIKERVLYTAGQPRGMDYNRLLYKYHIGSIVNVRMENEHRNHNWYSEEIAWVRDSGIRYIELPISKENPIPDAQAQAEFLKIMSNKQNLPVLLHGSGNTTRVALLTAFWLVKTQNISVEEALATAQKMKEEPLAPDQKQFIVSLK